MKDVFIHGAEMYMKTMYISR